MINFQLTNFRSPRLNKKPSYRVRFVIALLFASLPVLQSLADDVEHNQEFSQELNQWTLRKEKDGVSIYSRPVPESRYEEFKGVVEFEATQASALALLDDVNSCKQWIHRCESSVILTQVDGQQRYVYQISTLPFPAATRDAIFHATVLQQDVNTIRVELESAPEYIEETKYVRIRIAKGHYLITKLDENSIRLTWIQHVDPAGSLPAFMVNSLLTDLPFKSLNNFRKLVTTKKYRDAVFIFDDHGTRTGLVY